MLMFSFYDFEPSTSYWFDISATPSVSLLRENILIRNNVVKIFQMEMEDIDEDIKLWSSGKETNIRLLLSTLHHVRILNCHRNFSKMYSHPAQYAD